MMINNFEIPQERVIVQLNELSQHPKHQKYYGVNEFIPESLLSNINDLGVIDLPIINPEYEVLIGWRRIQVLKDMGHNSIEVFILRPPQPLTNEDCTVRVDYAQLLKDSEEQIIVDSNQHREKTWLSKAKEIQFLYKLLENNPERPRRERAILSEKFGINEKYIDFLLKLDLDDPDVKDLLEKIDNNEMTFSSAIQN